MGSSALSFRHERWRSLPRALGATPSMMLRALVRFGRRLVRYRTDASLRPAFDVWARPWTTLFLVIGLVGYGGIVLLVLWPLDLLTISDSSQRATFGWLRATNILTCLISLAGLTTSWVRRHVVSWGGLTTVALATLAGVHASSLPHDPFYWPVFFAHIALGFMLVPFLERLAWNVALGIVYNVVWYSKNPTQLHDPATPSMLGIYATAIVLGTANGSAIYVFAWQVFRGQRELDRKRAELADFNARLENEVQKKTAEVRHLAQRVERLHEDERRRMASELHDELGQTMTALRLEVALLEKGLASGAVAAETATTLHAQLDDLFESVRWLVSSLRPKALEERGLVAGCEWLVERFRARTGIAAEASLEDVDVVEESRSLTIFRVLQEALTNVAKHAEAEHVTIALAQEGSSITLSIEDDGVGFDPSRTSEGHGLLAMRERALASDAVLSIERRSVSGTSGTRIVLRMEEA